MSAIKTREKRERRVSSPVAALLAGKRKRPNTPSGSPASSSLSDRLDIETVETDSAADGGESSTLVENVLPLTERLKDSDTPMVVDTKSSENDSEKIDSKEDDPVVTETEKSTSTCIFKNPAFVHPSAEGSATKKKVWKNLKQLIALERSTLSPDDVSYNSIEAPPSFKPAKKYCDITGLEANYTDPHTKLRYARTEEYSRIRMLPSDIVSGLLALRKANSTVP